MSTAGQEPLLLEEAQRALACGRARDAEALCQRAVDATPRSAAAWHLLGLARQKLGNHADAVQALSKASSLDKAFAAYHHDLGNALADDGKVDRAITAYRRALRVDETLAEVHNDLGAAYFSKHWHKEAEACFRKAIALKPGHDVAHANLGAALRAQGLLGDGRRAFQRALTLKIRAALPRFLQWKVAESPPASTTADSRQANEDLRRISDALAAGKLGDARTLAIASETRSPADPDMLQIAALAFEEFGELDQALARVQKAIELQPTRAEYSVSLARLQAKLGNESAAIAAAEHALRLEPGSAEVHSTLAGVYHLWRDDLAEAAARRAVELDPSLPLAQANLGSALWGLGRLEEAERHAREALRLLPSQLTFQANLAIILKDAGRFDEARSLYRALAAQAPDHPMICLNVGTLAFECDADLPAARRWYAKASAQLKDPRVTLSSAIVDLLEGSYEDGWNGYEARKQVGTHRHHHSLYSAFEAWDGRPLRGGRLLVYAEQGLGDEIMFASVLPDLARRIPSIVLACDPRLERLLARSFPGIELSPTPRDRPPLVSGGVERTVAMGSLGMHFRRHATDFPRQASFLVPDEAKAARWRERLNELGPARKIGISWRGGVQGTGRARRSLSLGRFQGLMETPDTNWISLQYGDCAGEVAAFTADTGIPLHAFAGVTDDMDDLASLMQALDLVISVCNTTVHLAGAIGKEVLVIAPFLPEWRYGMHGERMLWYPSARVFRQPAFGDWDSVLERVAQALTSKTRC